MDKVIVSTNEISETLLDLIQNGAQVPLMISGSSMRPLLKPRRDMVWLRPCKDSDIKKGRILLFRRRDGSLILHRIRKILPENKLLMNGDAQAWCESIDRKQIIAIVYEIKRKEKQIPWDFWLLRCWDMVWSITIKFRPFLFKIWTVIRSFC